MCGDGKCDNIRGFLLTTAAICLSCLPLFTPAAQDAKPALLLLSCKDAASFRQETARLSGEGIRILHLFPPYAVIASVPQARISRLSARTDLMAMRQDRLSQHDLDSLDQGHRMVARVWNDAFMAAKTEAQPSHAEPPQDDALEPPSDDMPLRATESLGCPAGGPSQMVSEFMLAAVSLNVILPESTGAIDADTEDWDSAREAQVLAGVVAGTQWLLERAPSGPGVALSFTYHLYSGRTDARATTSYEPITRSADPVHEPGVGEGLWTNEILNAFGYSALPDRWTKARAFDNDTRIADGTNWAVTVFVADSLNDADGRFTDGRFAYTWQPGSHIVMTYDNSGWGITRMGSVFAHELCHAFWAKDEYAGSGCSCTQSSGYLDASNGNCAATCQTSLSTCVMRSTDLSGDAGIVCAETARQIGWADGDGNGVPDSVQAPPFTQLDAPALQSGQVTLGGWAQVQAAPNLNPSPMAYTCPITVARVADVQVRLNGGPWQETIPLGGAFTGQDTSFTYTSGTLSAGTYTVDTRTLDTLGQEQITSTTFTVEGSVSAPPPISDGSSVGHPAMTARASAGDIAITWDAACAAAGTSLYWGFGSGLPGTPGGAYTLSGSECGIGGSGTYTWSGGPDPAADPSRLVWWVIVANDGAQTEGSWGRDSSGAERNGTQASGRCGLTSKDASNPGC